MTNSIGEIKDVDTMFIIGSNPTEAHPIIGLEMKKARRRGASQSAVSQQIASLERLVGERLFDRPGGPKPVTLTAAGRLVLRHAERIIEQVGIFERDLNGHKTGTVGRIEVGVFQSVAVKVLPSVRIDTASWLCRLSWWLATTRKSPTRTSASSASAKRRAASSTKIGLAALSSANACSSSRLTMT